MAASQKQISPLAAPALATSPPDGWNASSFTRFASARSEHTCSPLDADQSRSQPSSSPDAIKRPSWRMAIACRELP